MSSDWRAGCGHLPPRPWSHLVKMVVHFSTLPIDSSVASLATSGLASRQGTA